MRADVNLLCINVYRRADGLSPARPGNGRRTDRREIVTLCVAGADGDSIDRRCCGAARRQCGTCSRIPARTRWTNAVSG